MTKKFNDLITVVSGFYNRENTAIDSVNSILNQTYSNIEFLVFDDCSTDATLEKLKSIRDRRLNVIEHEKNKGFTRGMIDAIKMANGKYIAVHGSGDLSHPSRLEKQKEVLENHPDFTLVGCLSRSLNFRNKEVINTRRFDKNEYSRGELIENVPFTHGSAFFRKAEYDSVGGYNKYFRYCQDRNLWMKLTQLGNCFVVNEILYDQIVDLNSVSTAFSKMSEQTFYIKLAKMVGKGKVNEKALNDDLIDRLKKRHKVPLNKVFMKYLRMESIQHKELPLLLKSNQAIFVIHYLRKAVRKIGLNATFLDKGIRKVFNTFY